VVAFTVLLPLLLESGKLFFVGRVPRVDNAIVGAVGGLCGIFLVPVIINSSPIKRRPIDFLILLLLALLIHSELSPYNWIQSLHEIPSRLARIEWLPLVSYYRTVPQSAVFDLGKKLLLMAPLALLLAEKADQKGLRSRWLVVMIAVLIGTALEACQIALRTRIPSITDVLIFGIAARVGASVHDRYRMTRRPGPLTGKLPPTSNGSGRGPLITTGRFELGPNNPFAE
jgi:VanZ family protein